MRPHLPFALLGVTATALVAAVAVPAAGPAAAARAPAPKDTACVIDDFSPHSQIMGLSPVSTTFAVKTHGCTLAWWDLQATYLYAYSSQATVTFDPYDNSLAGPEDVTARADNGTQATTTKVFPDGFALKRESTWQTGTFNASPEPVRKGKPITIKARLMSADWTLHQVVPFGGHLIGIEFRTPTGSYGEIKAVTTDANGWVNTTVPAVKTGVWRVIYKGYSLAGPAVVLGDSVQVTS